MAVRPLSIGIYDKGFVRRGVIGAPKFVTVVPRFNKVGTTTVGLLGNDPSVLKCMEDGARLWIKDENGGHLMSGPVVRVRGYGPSKRSLFEVDIEDDFRLLLGVLGWVQPTQTIDNQGIAGDNWTMTGTAEAVLKAAVQANAVDRLGLPLTVAPSQGRGSSITAKLRFHPLYDRLFPVQDGAGIDAAGIGVTVKQKPGGGLELDCYTPSTYPRTLTEQSGVVIDWNFNYAAPTATRAVIGGQGEAQLRVFRRVEDLALETQIGTIIERFRDARDTNDNLILYARGNETLTEGKARAGLSVTLSQTANFRYGSSVKVGDRVPLKVGPDILITDTLTEATLSWTATDGWKATPKVGDVIDRTDRAFLTALQRITRYVTNQNRM